MKKIVIILFVLAMINTNLYSQKKQISIGGGVNYSFMDSTTFGNVVVANSLSPDYGSQINISYRVDFADSSLFYISADALIAYRRLIESHPVDIITNKPIVSSKWNLFTLDIPVLLNLKYEKWLIFSVGINNKFKIWTDDVTLFQYKNIKPYTLGLAAVLEIRPIKHFSLKAWYLHDMTTFLNFTVPNSTDERISYKMRSVNISIMYYL